VSNHDDVPDGAQALSVLEKALQDAIAVMPLEHVLVKVTAMFPKSPVDIDAGEGRLHSRVQKVSVSMPEELITAVRERTGPGGFSRYVTDAVERQYRHDGLRDYLDELDAQHGPVPAGLIGQARREWPDYEGE
jgi:hypothetical protein